MTTDNPLHAHFTGALMILFEETFENGHGIFLDRGTSLFETLATISADEASIPVGGRCATLAAQVEHITFYLDTILLFVQGQQPEKVDWQHIWNTVGAVTPEAWQASIQRLRDRYQQVRAVAMGWSEWRSPQEMGGVMGMLCHTAYHLGEIRQALCTLKA